MDHHATTAVEPRVLARMLPYFCEKFGNAASRSHAFGWQAEEAVEVARGEVATLIGAHPTEIVFTSGATEANNLALSGIVAAYVKRGDHVVTQATEHKAVLDVLLALERRGEAHVTVLPVDEYGVVSPEAVAAACTERTVLVSIMAANNEVGTLQPLAQLGAVCRAKGALLHCDAAQALGHVAFNVEAHNVDLASFSAHKLYGPKGVGALYVRRKAPRVSLLPILHGGGHERGLRSGTLNVPGIVGFGAAAALARLEGEAEAAREVELREALRDAIMRGLDGVHCNGHPTARLPGNLSLSFADLEADALLLSLRDVALSSGSACTSVTLEPSHVLRALGVPPALAAGTIRFGIGRSNTREHVDYVATAVIAAVTKLRALR